MQQAVALPNFGSMNGPTQLEKGCVSDALVNGLKARGHDVQVVEMNSGPERIQRLNVEGRTIWFGGAAPRREGVAIGD